MGSMKLECELIDRINALKESETTMRTERQELEKKVRHMRCKRLKISEVEG